MKRLMLLVLTASLRLGAADAHMTAEERAKVVKWLGDSQKEFLAATTGLTAEQCKWKPAPNRWSVCETAEHIVLAEAGLFANLKKALAAPASPDWETKTKGKTETIEMVMAPRMGKATAPEELVPSGTWTAAEARERFEKQRLEIAEFAGQTDIALKEHLAPHPFPVFNPLNAYQWLIYIPLHTMRHDKQIAEVKSAPGYPQ